tara:strand:- start:43 stop:552 length:510 start_codon:yes stop_codon:yes gene_type:complete
MDIKLIDGMGQLGEILSSKIDKFQCEKPTFIYHTWNVWDRSYEDQKKNYDTFVKFVLEHEQDKIIFVSTYSEENNFYVHFKQLAEAFLLTNHENSFIIKLPNLVGNKGILRRMRDRQIKPYGKIEFVTLEDAANEILKLVNYNGLVKSFCMSGELISAKLVNEILYRVV